MENDNDWAARRHQQNADDLWGSEGGSINHWNAHFEAQKEQQLADAQRVWEAAAVPTATSWSPPSFNAVTTPVYSGPNATSGRSAPIDDSQVGLVLWKLFKWTVLPLLVASALAAALWWGVREADRAWIKRDPNGGFTRYATSQVFPGEDLAATSTYLSVGDDSSTLQGTALIAALRAVKRPFAVADPRNARLLASAYRCQSSGACRLSVAKAAPELQISMLDLVVAYLGNKAKTGSELAARDGCLLPLLTGTTPQAVFLGRNACTMMVVANRKSPEARIHLAKMEDSGWFKLARVMAAEEF